MNCKLNCCKYNLNKIPVFPKSHIDRDLKITRSNYHQGISTMVQMTLSLFERWKLHNPYMHGSKLWKYNLNEMAKSAWQKKKKKKKKCEISV